MNKAKSKDVTVTQDLGLTSMLVNRGVYVLSPRGKVYTEGEIEQRLFMRHVSAKERRKGFYSKVPKPFTDQDRQQFKNKLSRNFVESCRNSLIKKEIVYYGVSL